MTTTMPMHHTVESSRVVVECVVVHLYVVVARAPPRAYI